MGAESKKLDGGPLDAVKERTLTETRRLSDVPAAPLPKFLSKSGLDIVKKGSNRRNRYMLVFNLQLHPICGGKLGTLAQLDTQSPVLYVDFPQGRLKLFGTMCFSHCKYVVLRGTAHQLLCEDVLESMIVFTEAWWVGTAEDNPGELRLPLPDELAGAYDSVASAAYAAAPDAAATPLTTQATPTLKRLRDDAGGTPDSTGSSRRTARKLALDSRDAGVQDGLQEQPSSQVTPASERPRRAAAQRASQQIAQDSSEDDGDQTSQDSDY